MRKNNKMSTLLKMIFFCLVTVLLLSGAKSLVAQAAAVTATPGATEGIQHVYDDAGLLSSSELSDIEEMCTTYSKEAGIDIIILTHDDPKETDNGAYIDDFVDRTDYDNGVVLSIDMAGHNVDLQGYGQAETYLHSKRLNAIREEITSYLTDAEYANAFKIYIEDSAAYMKDDSELNYDHDYSYDQYGNYTGSYDSGYDSQTTTARDVLTNGFFQLVVALIIGGIAVGIMVYNSGGKMTAGGNTYIDGGHSGLIGRRDNYIRTTVTRVRRPTQNNSRPGGFNAGGFSGGISGGGHSHSSSHGKF